jgi:sirohydrochlorin ferrochelatase
MKVLIIVDHGSREPAANAIVEAVAAAIRPSGRYDLVEAAHLEAAVPRFDEVLDRCAAAGASGVTIVPYFLAPGRHAMQDIPRIAAARLEGTGVPWRIAEPLGFDAALVDLVVRRAAAAG